MRKMLGDAGVVDHHVEAAERLLGMVDGGVNLVAVADVGDEGRRLSAQRLNLPGHTFQLVGLDVDECEIGAILRQTQRDAATDALARSSDQNGFLLDRHEPYPFDLLQRVCAANSFSLRWLDDTEACSPL